MATPAILVNVNRCTGCWTCSLACKVGHKLDTDEWWQYVNTIGDGKGVDSPGGTWPNLFMKWEPVYTKKCTLCADRTVEGDQPFCVFNCPTEALTYGDADDPESPFNVRIEELKELGFGVYKRHAWEGTRDNIYYAEKVTAI